MSRLSAPVGPKTTRLESAQLPAKAAPNTSAPMRTAALTTVSTWIQTILRFLLRSLITVGPVGRGNVPETEGSIKLESRPDQAPATKRLALTACPCAGRRAAYRATYASVPRVRR